MWKFYINRLVFIAYARIWKTILFHFDRKAYDAAIREKIAATFQAKEEIWQNALQKQEDEHLAEIAVWRETWRAQHKATGVAYWGGYAHGYNDRHLGRLERK